MKLIFSIFFVILLTSCSTSSKQSPKHSKASTTTIKYGMSSLELEKEMGAPDRRNFKKNVETWFYHPINKIVTIKDGKVIELKDDKYRIKKLEREEKKRLREEKKLRRQLKYKKKNSLRKINTRPKNTQQKNIPKCSGYNTYGYFAKGGGCAPKGCWPKGGSCNLYGCTAKGICLKKGCPEPIKDFKCKK